MTDDHAHGVPIDDEPHGDLLNPPGPVTSEPSLDGDAEGGSEQSSDAGSATNGGEEPSAEEAPAGAAADAGPAGPTPGAEQYPEDLRRLSAVAGEAMQNMLEHYEKVLSPSLDALRRAIASSVPTANLAPEVFKDFRIPGVADMSRNLSKQIDGIVRSAVPRLSISRVEASKLFSVTPGRISQIAKAAELVQKDIQELFPAPALPHAIDVEVQRLADLVRRRPAAAREDVVTGLERLAALHEKGVLTQEEFTAAKSKLLTGE